LIHSTKNLSETHILGKGTTWIAVRGGLAEERKWLSSEPLSVELDDVSIAHAGIMCARAGFSVVRRDLSGSFFAVTLEGRGRVLVDGQWRVLKTGEACLLPRHQINAIRHGAGACWTFCWVRYHEEDEQVPMATGHSPTLGGCASGTALKCAIEGLREERLHGRDPVVTRMWIELLQKYVVAFALPRMKDPRIARAWDEASLDVSKQWTLRTLAQKAHISPEHFRRLCIAQFGRTPIKHLTHLRMRYAAELLTSSHEKIETIAHMVGFKNPFTFSNTFMKWTGFRPSEYRGKKRDGVSVTSTR